MRSPGKAWPATSRTRTRPKASTRSLANGRRAGGRDSAWGALRRVKPSNGLQEFLDLEWLREHGAGTGPSDRSGRADEHDGNVPGSRPADQGSRVDLVVRPCAQEQEARVQRIQIAVQLLEGGVMPDLEPGSAEQLHQELGGIAMWLHDQERPHGGLPTPRLDTAGRAVVKGMTARGPSGKGSP